MKELSIEQKARRYDEVVNEIKNLRDMLLKEGVINKDGVICDNFNRIFPELKESEDEKIRKRIINALHGDVLDIEETAKAIAWLEKQKEPKHLDTSTCEPWSDEQTRRNLINFLKSLGATEIPQASYNRYLSYLEKQGEQKPVEWSEEDESMLNNVIDTLVPLSQTTHSGYAIGSMINWLKCLKDRVQPQPKPVWSEEDEKMFEHIIAKATLHFSSINYLDEEEINFLKSLRPQNRCTYNPYKEVVESIAEMCEKYEDANLDSLKDFYSNVKVKCKDAKEYDSLFPQSSEAMEAE